MFLWRHTEKLLEQDVKNSGSSGINEETTSSVKSMMSDAKSMMNSTKSKAPKIRK